jgi:succinoglycan biosynthesis transport protein ExoP
MNTQLPPEQPAGSSLGVNDILFIVFRHKWKIIAFSLLGIVASGAIWFTKTPLYESSARILVKYVSDTKSLLDGGEADITSPDFRGNTVVSSEIAILTSGDSIMDTVRTVSPQRILAAYDGGTNLAAAGAAVFRNFTVDAGKNSSVLVLSLKHPDAQIAQELLERIIRNYQRKHLEVHRAGDAYDELQQRTESLGTRLRQTEEDLRRAKNQAGVINLEQAKEDTAKQMSTLRESIYETEALMAERRVLLGLSDLPAAGGSSPSAGPPAALGNGSTNNGPVASVPTGPVVNSETNAPVLPPSATELAQYALLTEKLAALRAKELELKITYREGSEMMRQHRQQVDGIEQALKSLGIDPASLAAKAATAAPSRASSRAPSFDPEAGVAGLRALQAKYQTLTNQYARVREEASRIDAAENVISGLQRKKDIEEVQYTYFAKSFEQARLDQALDSTKLNNINILQEPTAGSPATDMKIMKLAGGSLVGGVGFGFALAFLLDLFIDPSVKRRKDIESIVKLPVFAAIPHFGRNGHSQLKSAGRGALAAPDVGPDGTHAGKTAWPKGEIPPWEESDPMLPYYEALRDRIVMSYDGDSHKPKIVGLTSCDKDAGVTRLATGLAAALSRDVQRDVLLIGLEKNRVSISAFAKGRPSDGLESMAENRRNLPLILSDNSTVPIHEHSDHLSPHDSTGATSDLLARDLHSLATTGRNLAGASIVQSFSDLMPRLKVSNYDYIIFDLPPISQTSGSIRLASQMERTLLVVEAEKTSKDKIKSAKEFLIRSKTQLATILNKSHVYGPGSLGIDD